MLMVREVMHCKPGKVKELVGKFQALGSVMEEMGLAPFRLYTDLAAERFWTMIAEREYEGLDEMVALEERVMADERAGAAMAGYHEIVIEGRREIYRVVD
jgi:hypothetical protein